MNISNCLIYFSITLKKKIQKLLQRLESKGAKRVIFFGATELAEIAYLALYDTNLELADVLDDLNVGKRFFDHTVQPVCLLNSIRHDRIILTSTEPPDIIQDKLEEQGVSPDRMVIMN
jgi:hypothetical protein